MLAPMMVSPGGMARFAVLCVATFIGCAVAARFAVGRETTALLGKLAVLSLLLFGGAVSVTLRRIEQYLEGSKRTGPALSPAALAAGAVGTTLLFVAVVFASNRDSIDLALKVTSVAGLPLALFIVATSFVLATAERGGVTFVVLIFGGLATLT